MSSAFHTAIAAANFKTLVAARTAAGLVENFRGPVRSQWPSRPMDRVTELLGRRTLVDVVREPRRRWRCVTPDTLEPSMARDGPV